MNGSDAFGLGSACACADCALDSRADCALDSRASRTANVDGGLAGLAVPISGPLTGAARGPARGPASGPARGSPCGPVPGPWRGSLANPPNAMRNVTIFGPIHRLCTSEICPALAQTLPATAHARSGCPYNSCSQRPAGMHSPASPTRFRWRIARQPIRTVPPGKYPGQYLRTVPPGQYLRTVPIAPRPCGS